jgi:hypothetical protein
MSGRDRLKLLPELLKSVPWFLEHMKGMLDE